MWEMEKERVKHGRVKSTAPKSRKLGTRMTSLGLRHSQFGFGSQPSQADEETLNQ
jgi:hypothetical protein